MGTRLGELLVKRGLLSSEQLAQAQETEKMEGTSLACALVKLSHLDDAGLTAFLQKEYRLPLVDPAAMEVPEEVLRLVPMTLVQRHSLVPISLAGSTLTLAMCDPSNLAAINEIKFLTGYDVKVAVAATASINLATKRFFDQGTNVQEVLAEVESQQRDVEVVDESDDVDLAELEKSTRGGTGRPASERRHHERDQAAGQ